MGLRDLFSFLRRSGAAEPPGSPETIMPPARAPEWQTVPALQRTVPDLSLVTDPTCFRQDLVTWGSPSFLAAPGHLLSPEAPAGSVSGLARSVPSEGPALPPRLSAATGIDEATRRVQAPSVQLTVPEAASTTAPPTAPEPVAAAWASGRNLVSAASAQLPPPVPRPALPLQRLAEPGQGLEGAAEGRELGSVQVSTVGAGVVEPASDEAAPDLPSTRIPESEPAVSPAGMIAGPSTATEPTVSVSGTALTAFGGTDSPLVPRPAALSGTAIDHDGEPASHSWDDHANSAAGFPRADAADPGTSPAPLQRAVHPGPAVPTVERLADSVTGGQPVRRRLGLGAPLPAVPSPPVQRLSAPAAGGAPPGRKPAGPYESGPDMEVATPRADAGVLDLDTEVPATVEPPVPQPEQPPSVPSTDGPSAPAAQRLSKAADPPSTPPGPGGDDPSDHGTPQAVPTLGTGSRSPAATDLPTPGPVDPAPSSTAAGGPSSVLQRSAGLGARATLPPGEPVPATPLAPAPPAEESMGVGRLLDPPTVATAADAAEDSPVTDPGREGSPAASVPPVWDGAPTWGGSFAPTPLIGETPVPTLGQPVDVATGRRPAPAIPAAGDGPAVQRSVVDGSARVAHPEAPSAPEPSALGLPPPAAGDVPRPPIPEPRRDEPPGALDEGVSPSAADPGSPRAALTVAVLGSRPLQLQLADLPVEDGMPTVGTGSGPAAGWPGPAAPPAWPPQGHATTSTSAPRQVQRMPAASRGDVPGRAAGPRLLQQGPFLLDPIPVGQDPERAGAVEPRRMPPVAAGVSATYAEAGSTTVQTAIALDDRPAATVPSASNASEAPATPEATVLEFSGPGPLWVQTLAADTPADPMAQGSWLAPLAEAPPAAPAAGTSPAPAGTAAVPPGEIDALVRRLYDPLVRRLKAELRLDRERVGRSLDLRH